MLEEKGLTLGLLRWRLTVLVKNSVIYKKKNHLIKRAFITVLSLQNQTKQAVMLLGCFPKELDEFTDSLPA